MGKNTPIADLLADYEANGCDHADMAWVRAAARRYVETMPDSQARCLLHVLAQEPAEAQAQGGGEALEAELIALVAGPYHYHHKMDEHAEREGKAFDRCRELTIQNIRTWCATRRAMLAAQPPSAPVGVEDGPIDASDNAEYIEHCADRLERCGLRITAGALRVIAHEHRSLAQQPAAVDGAMSPQVAKDWLLELMGDHDFTLPTEAFDELVGALAAQQGGSDNE